MTQDQLKINLAMAGDVIEGCKVLLNYCLLDENSLSDDQFDILLDVFGEEEIASHSLMYIYSMGAQEESNKPLIDDLFNIMYQKFSERNKETINFSNKNSIYA